MWEDVFQIRDIKGMSQHLRTIRNKYAVKVITARPVGENMVFVYYVRKEKTESYASNQNNF